MPKVAWLHYPLCHWYCLYRRTSPKHKPSMCVRGVNALPKWWGSHVSQPKLYQDSGVERKSSAIHVCNYFPLARAGVGGDGRRLERCQLEECWSGLSRSSFFFVDFSTHYYDFAFFSTHSENRPSFVGSVNVLEPLHILSARGCSMR